MTGLSAEVISARVLSGIVALSVLSALIAGVAVLLRRRHGWNNSLSAGLVIAVLAFIAAAFVDELFVNWGEPQGTLWPRYWINSPLRLRIIPAVVAFSAAILAQTARTLFGRYRKAG